jgi:hypothetical protein
MANLPLPYTVTSLNSQPEHNLRHWKHCRCPEPSSVLPHISLFRSVHMQLARGHSSANITRRSLLTPETYCVTLSTELNFANNGHRERAASSEMRQKLRTSICPRFEPLWKKKKRQARRSIDCNVTDLPLTDEDRQVQTHTNTQPLPSLLATRLLRSLLSRALRGRPVIDHRPRTGHWNAHTSWARPDLEIDMIRHAFEHPSTGTAEINGIW